MPLFALKFERAVTNYETVHRVIEAETLERAQQAGEIMALNYNENVPDDAEQVQGPADAGSWIAEASDDAEDADCPDSVASEILGNLGGA